MFRSLTVFLFLAAAARPGLAPAQAPPASSTLPLVIIDTNGQTIVDEPKIDAEMRIVNNGAGQLNRPGDPATDYEGRIGIEVRGASSAGYPQTPYDLETRTLDGENRNVPLLGMPEENDWLLLSNYNDRSFARNTLSFDLFRRMGHYAPRTRLVEVILNNRYRGIYLFTEEIKQDDDRVDIAKLDADDVAGDSLTGGYIFQANYVRSGRGWWSSFPAYDDPSETPFFLAEDPGWADLHTAQKAYIEQFVHDAQAALYGDSFADPATGYRQFFDVGSFIDFFITRETSRNVDAYKKSRYFHKDRDQNDPLLHAGPVWDADWAWKNIREWIHANTDGSGWAWRVNQEHTPDRPAPGWYVRLLQDGYFTERLIARYQELRQDVLDPDRIDAYLDSVATVVASAQERHFQVFSINNTGAPEVEPPPRSYAEEIARMKAWTRTRITWLDANIPGLRDFVTVPLPAGEQPTELSVRIFPNPTSSYLSIEADTPMVSVRIYDLLGREVLEEQYGSALARRVDVGALQAGLYFVHVTQADGRSVTRAQHVAGR